MAKFHALTVKDLTKETLDCTSIAFDLPTDLVDTFQFKQGQYLTLKTELEGEEIRRSYSICTAPQDGELRVAVKKLFDGQFSTFANEQLQVGDTLDVMPPMGKFYTELAPTQAKNYVAFAAGSGITPIMSIMKSVLETEPNSTFTLFYGNKYASSVIFKEAIEGLKNCYLERLRVFYFFSREISDIPLFSGRLNGEKVQEAQNKLLDFKAIDDCFICGPEEMIFSIKGALEEIGVDSKKIHFELFATAANKGRKKRQQTAEKQDERVSRVLIKDGGNSFEFNLPFDTVSVLDGALSRGGNLPFACKGGVCCTCKAKLIEGEVEMDVNYALEPEEVENGFILSCQAFPKTERLVVDFDEAL